MASLDRSAASLRIFGDELDPKELTLLLGCEPSGAERKGQEIVGRSTGKVRVAKTGSWRLSATKREPGNLDAQIEEILSKLSSDLSVWRMISERYRVDLFCGLFLNGENEGLTISSKSLSDLGNRGIELGFDIYGSDAVTPNNSLERTRER
jgi:hypothetical protein